MARFWSRSSPEHRRSTFDYIRDLRRELPQRFPDLTFSFTSRRTSSARFSISACRRPSTSNWSAKIAPPITRSRAGSPNGSSSVPGAVDVHVHQVVAAPAAADQRRPRAGRRRSASRSATWRIAAGLVRFEQRSSAELLAQPAKRRQLPGRRADTPVPDRFRRRLATGSRSRAAGGSAQQLLANLATSERGTTATVATTTTSSPSSTSTRACRTATWAAPRATSDVSDATSKKTCRAARSIDRARSGREHDRPHLPVWPPACSLPSCWSTADGGELSVLARSLHHHYRAARRSRRHRVDRCS